MTREAAVAAARRGWSVFPCLPGDKRPAVPAVGAARRADNLSASAGTGRLPATTSVLHAARPVSSCSTSTPTASS